MSSPYFHWLELTLPNGLRLLGILVIALVLNRLLRAVTNLLIKHAATQARIAQLREQQTRTVAGILVIQNAQIVLRLELKRMPSCRK